MAQNICFFSGTFLIILSILSLFGKVVASDCYVSPNKEIRRCGIETCDTVDVNQCGSLKIEQPFILGRNVTFTFTPETISDADLEWQRAKEGNPWCPLPNNNKFTQYFQDGIYYLILTDTVRRDDEVLYRVDYRNNSVSCLMETSELRLKDIPSSQCGYVYLRTRKVKEGENVELEYYPSKSVMQNPEYSVRKWYRSEQDSTRAFPITLKKDVYEEEKEPNDKYVLTIIMFNEQMNGRYGVYCDAINSHSNYVKVIKPVAPSAPVFEGLRDIDDCKECIVGEDGDEFSVLCKTSGGTEPIKVTMSIGNESLSPDRYYKTAGYIKYFRLHNSHHMAIMTCKVMNDALTSPLTITARVYVIKSPTFQSFTVPEILKEGSIDNITCILNGGRPAPNVTLKISGMEVSTAVQADSFNVNTSLYTSVVSLTTLERIWNNENVACCRYNEWYRVQNECLTSKRLNFIFPPADIKLDVKVEQTFPHKIYAVCTIYNSNPACAANISVPNGVIVSERHTRNVSKPHGAWNSEHAVNLNVSKDDKGQKIECAADCQHFDVDLKDARTIVQPYAPIIDFNISGSELAILQGEQAHVKCSAQSIPASNISWVEQTDDGIISMKRCHLKTDCVITIEANLTQQRQFICQSHYSQTSDQKRLTVNILEKDEKRYKYLDNSASGDNLFIWIILGSCLAVLFVVVTVCLITRKKLRNTKAKLEANQARSSANPDGVRSKEDKLEDDPHGNLNDGAHGADDSEVTYSQPVKNKPSSNADATYSEINKTGKSNSSAICSTKTQQDGQLLYADLDFDPNDAPFKGAAAKRRNTPTEYVAIDFVKTAAEQAKEKEPAEADNIYANQ